MQCSADDVACFARQLWEMATDPSWRGYLWNILKDLAAITGVALAALKWWERREGVVYGKLSGLLGEQGTQTRDACRYLIRQIKQPGPADPQRAPIFAEKSLLHLFNKRHWKPVFSFAGSLTSADRKLRRAHGQLDKRQTAATNYQTFINEQRFAAHMLQGAIASGRTETTTNEVRLNKLNDDAIENFEKALRVPGKSGDLDALELKGLHLRKRNEVDLDIADSAPHIFVMLENAAARRRDALNASAVDERRHLTFAIARSIRYRAEMLHSLQRATGIGRDLLDGIEPSLNNADRLSWRELLDRARFYEVDACIRVALRGGGGPITSQRIRASVRDYSELRAQCDPRNQTWPARISRFIGRLFRNNGAKELLREANAGLERIRRIQNGEGCPLCQHQDGAPQTKPSPQAAIVPTQPALPHQTNNTPLSPGGH